MVGGGGWRKESARVLVCVGSESAGKGNAVCVTLCVWQGLCEAVCDVRGRECTFVSV